MIENDTFIHEATVRF